MTHAAPTKNDLGTVITNPRARYLVYAAYVFALIVVGASQAALSAIHVPAPDWLTAASAVVTYLGIPVGGLAAVNVRKKP